MVEEKKTKTCTIKIAPNLWNGAGIILFVIGIGFLFAFIIWIHLFVLHLVVDIVEWIWSMIGALRYRR